MRPTGWQGRSAAQVAARPAGSQPGRPRPHSPPGSPGLADGQGSWRGPDPASNEGKPNMTKQTNRKPGATAAASATAPDAYTRITTRIVADWEQGVRPWCKPWGGAHSPARAFARVLAGPTQLAIERGGVALQDHL